MLADVERVLGGRLADMTWTDPPYNVAYGSSAKDRLRGKQRPVLNDALGSGFEAFLYDACVNILSVTKGACYVCMSSSELDALQRAFRAAGGRWSTFIIWAKHAFTLGRADYRRQHEPILYGWNDGSDHAGAARGTRATSKSRDVVLDPFGGAGSTLIACAKTGRRACLVELDPTYVDVICRRFEAFAGQPAVLEGDGRGFGALAAERHGS